MNKPQDSPGDSQGTSSALVTYERKGRIGFITLNRPDKLNAISDEMSEQLCNAFYQLDDDAQAHVGIISGNGRAFCSGADVQQRQLRPREELERLGGPVGRGIGVTAPLYRATNFKPIVAAVHGYVMGLGLLISCICDIVVAAPDTRFQITETRRGVSGGHFWALIAQRCWPSFADDLAITGRFWLAEEGLQKGQIQYLSGAGEHVARATEVANEILKNPPLAVRAVVRERRMRLEALDVQSYSVRTQNLHLTEDFRESALAFMEKREPVFKGR